MTTKDLIKQYAKTYCLMNLNYNELVGMLNSFAKDINNLKKL